MILLRGRVVLPEVMIDDGVVVARGDRLVFVGPAAEARDAGFGDRLSQVPPSYDYLLPGLVDLHNHGGGGVGFSDAADAGQALAGVLEHRRHGTTTMLASLVTADPESLVARVAMLAELAEAGEIAGIHVEGPFLSAERCGAQDPALLRDGDAALVRDLAKVARGHLATMTVAPEVPGVAGPGGAAMTLVEAGTIPSLGHTDATTEVAEVLISQVTAGLRLAAEVGGTLGHREMTVTHLFNGMRPLHHRSPGPVAACLAAAARGDLVAELIADGVHLDPATVRTVFGTVGADQIALVTDAMAAAGMADGSYDLGSLPVTVRDGVARLTGVTGPDGTTTEDGVIAGGTAHLVDVVRHTVRAGVPLLEAVRSASAVPARVLGLDRELGTLARGLRADVLVADEELRPRRVLRAGTEAAVPGR